MHHVHENILIEGTVRIRNVETKRETERDRDRESLSNMMNES